MLFCARTRPGSIRLPTSNDSLRSRRRRGPVADVATCFGDRLPGADRQHEGDEGLSKALRSVYEGVLRALVAAPASRVVLGRTAAIQLSGL